MKKIVNLKLTKRQAEVLSFIKDFRDLNGYSPTLAEIANEFGFRSQNAASDHVDALVRKNAVKRAYGVGRGIVPTNQEKL